MTHAELSKVIYEEGLMANYPGRIDDFYKGIADRIAAAVEKRIAVTPVVASLPSKEEIYEVCRKWTEYRVPWKDVQEHSVIDAFMAEIGDLFASRVSVMGVLSLPSANEMKLIYGSAYPGAEWSKHPAANDPGFIAIRDFIAARVAVISPAEPPISMKCVSCQKESSFTREQVEKFPIVCTPECHRRFYCGVTDSPDAGQGVGTIKVPPMQALDPPELIDATRKKAAELRDVYWGSETHGTFDQSSEQIQKDWLAVARQVESEVQSAINLTLCRVFERIKCGPDVAACLQVVREMQKGKPTFPSIESVVRAAKREAYAAAKQIAFSNADYPSTQAIRDLMDALDTEKPK